MTIKRLIVLALAAMIPLAGCTANNTRNVDDYANRNRGMNEPTKVHYNREGETPLMNVADRVADRVADLPEVDRAYVITTDETAYVAAKLTSDNKKLTSDVKKKIADRVKATDKSVDNVYVSENPDFYDRMKGYAHDVRSGRPISEIFNEFSKTVRRIFPTQK